MNQILFPLLLISACLLPRAKAAISVGAFGSGVLTFDTAPATSDWASATLPGTALDIDTPGALYAAVLSLSVAGFTSPLGLTTSTNASQLARYNSTGGYLQSRPTSVAATVLLATLQNDTGFNQSAVTLSYNFRAVNPLSVTIAEELPGLQVYFSLSGTPGTWQGVPELSGDAVGTLRARVPVGFWAPGAPLYILWADDNAAANADNTATEEGAYVIDDFSALPGNLILDPLAGVTIPSPVSSQSFPEGAEIEIIVDTTPGLGAVTNVLLYDRSNFVGQVSSPHFPVHIFDTNAAPGLHELTAVGINSGIALTSTVVCVEVIASRPLLHIAGLGLHSVDIAWPDPSTGFELQSTADLLSGVWERVTDPDSPLDGFHHVHLQLNGASRFFRLEKR